MFDTWTWQNPERVHLLWAALLLVGVLGYLRLHSRDALASFLSPVMQRRLIRSQSTARHIAYLALVLAALLVCVLALMRPQARGETETVVQSSDAADVMFVLDVSRSMLAEDAAPNRLVRAKAEVAALVKKLPRHRVGLVVFAGRAVQLCPLTPDRSFFDLVLSGVSTSSAGRGGTRIGEAVKVALRSFPAGVGAKLIVLITDGEDQESFPLDAAKAARRAGVKIVAVGIGDENGSQIVITDPVTKAKTPMMHDGTPVISRLDGETLRQMALETEGAYVPAGVAALDLNSIMESYVRPIVDNAQGTTRVIPVERFPLFILAALVLLLAAMVVAAGTSRPESV